MKTKRKGWAIKSPSGEFLWDTLSDNYNLSWMTVGVGDLAVRLEHEEIGYKAVKVTITEGWEE